MATIPANTKAPLLSLEGVTELPAVEIQGTRYAMQTPNSLPIAGIRRFMRLGPRIDELFSKEEPTPEELTELATLLDSFTRLVLDAPASVHDTLSELGRWQIYQAFLGLSPNGPQKANSNKAGAASSPTGPKSARGSHVSTRAAIPGGGTRRRRTR